MTSATPKPRAGEHPEAETLKLTLKLAEAASYDPRVKGTFLSARERIEALEEERDLLRERERELVEALQTLQSSANCHLGKGGIMLPLEAAILHAGDVLAKYGR